jgi:ribulose bisphosphate carboxylase small subunit
MASWGEVSGEEVIDILVAPSLKNTLLAEVTKLTDTHTANDYEQILSEFMQRVLEHIDQVSRQQTRHFTYIHSVMPGHSFPGEQTSEQLASFRQEYVRLIQIANGQTLSIVRHILGRDPTALIIVNGDHGAWGNGNFMFTEMRILDSLPENVMALDQVGVLLAIRWPDGADQYDQDLRTNVNLFRHILYYLSLNTEILLTKVPDDSFILRGSGAKQIVRKVINDGEVMERQVEVESGTGETVSRK